MGNSALQLNTVGSYNSAMGSQALGQNTTGDYNVGVGYRANYYNQEGSQNTTIGYHAGRGNSIHNKSGNVFIGYQAGYYETGDNKLYIDNSDTSDPLIYGDFLNNTLTVNGKLGVGRSNPTTKLHVSRDTTTVPGTHPSTVMIIEDGNSDAYLQIMAPPSSQRAILFGEIGGQVNDGQIGYDDINGMRFWVDRGGANIVPLQIQMDGDVITGTGNVGIGTTTPTRKLFVNGQAGGTTSWSNDSDARLKKNVTTIENALQKVQQLRGVEYEWIDTENHSKGKQIGFIGQETKKVVPEVVDVQDDSYSMQYAPLTALLVQAMQEQQQQMETLQAENELLKQRLEILEKNLR
ncbi:MAG: tail fiber domain-containing protein [Planctomycetes bacterium]|nr:tail fiber domain-containing protein [Planctomycetota bacterium]